MSVKPEGWLPGATKDEQSITADWSFTNRDAIDGVVARQVRNVPKNGGFLTEVFREDWEVDSVAVDQVFQVTLWPGAISAWHVHGVTTDRLFAVAGLVHVVLYDARSSSPSQGRIEEHRIGPLRPTLVVIPPGVWHGVQNVGREPAILLNLVDVAYRYDDPDHWRLPAETPEIPYRFRETDALT